LKFVTEAESKGYSSNEDSLEVSMNDTIGFFSWNKTADIDGILKSVNVSTTLVDERMYINYNQGSKIFHDPKIGVAGLLRSLIPVVSGGGGGSSSKKKKQDAIPGFEIPIIIGISAITVIAVIYEIKKTKRKSVAI